MRLPAFQHLNCDSCGSTVIPVQVRYFADKTIYSLGCHPELDSGSRHILNLTITKH